MEIALVRRKVSSIFIERCRLFRANSSWYPKRAIIKSGRIAFSALQFHVSRSIITRGNLDARTHETETHSLVSAKRNRTCASLVVPDEGRNRRMRGCWHPNLLIQLLNSIHGRDEKRETAVFSDPGSFCTYFQDEVVDPWYTAEHYADHKREKTQADRHYPTCNEKRNINGRTERSSSIECERVRYSSWRFRSWTLEKATNNVCGSIRS
jgi:hypothetical protein